ncbi:hemin uptake protein HemP [Mesorhizobium sp. J18]|uniref:hemin uptake protein HemP n=1 Tax=Mesorhizobium sp. J18 TaxID=935263 RepID=UPI0011A49143|nr:hemin uptake protein HemP [Mesorhizobium sp. J18]
MNNANPQFNDQRRLKPSQGLQAVRTIVSEDLFRGSHEIAINHSGAIYRLKITRQGKLILNK